MREGFCSFNAFTNCIVIALLVDAELLHALQLCCQSLEPWSIAFAFAGDSSLESGALLLAKQQPGLKRPRFMKEGNMFQTMAGYCRACCFKLICVARALLSQARRGSSQEGEATPREEDQMTLGEIWLLRMLVDVGWAEASNFKARQDCWHSTLGMCAGGAFVAALQGARRD